MSDEIEELRARIVQLEAALGRVTPHFHSDAFANEQGSYLLAGTPCRICGQRNDAPIHKMNSTFR